METLTEVRIATQVFLLSFRYGIIQHFKSFIIIFLLERFSHRRYLMVFHRNPSDSNSPQVSRTLIIILADPTNAYVWMVSTRPIIS